MKEKKCTQEGCSEDTVGRAWFEEKGKWFPYCRKHLETARGLGFPIKLFSDTDILLDFEENYVE